MRISGTQPSSVIISQTSLKVPNITLGIVVIAMHNLENNHCHIDVPTSNYLLCVAYELILECFKLGFNIRIKASNPSNYLSSFNCRIDRDDVGA